MMDVKWATESNLYDDKEVATLQTALEKEGYPRLKFMPVMTLDAVERWLEGERFTVRNCALTADTIREHNWTIDYLLPQVQAAKEKGDS